MARKNTRFFEDLLASVQEMDEIARGEKAPSREFSVDADSVRAVREATGLSQAQFARLIEVQIGTLRNWEQGRRNPYPFEFHVLDDDRTINAFALPGGYVYVTRGLMALANNEGLKVTQEQVRESEGRVAEAAELGGVPADAGLVVLHGVGPSDVNAALASTARPCLNSVDQVERGVPVGRAGS